jgi:riboflavin synthase
MFTGIVEGTGKVLEIEERPGGRLLKIDASVLGGTLKIGSSVSVSGCCTTVVATDGRSFSTELMEVTLQKTNLGDLQKGGTVNLERPMHLGDELGGHMVQGHVDGVGVISKVTTLESSHLVEILLPPDLVKYVVATGSVAANGVSMTVADIQADRLTLGVIPHTWEVTNFHDFRPGVRVNLEVDMIGKYIEKLLPDMWQRLTTTPPGGVERTATA